MHDIKWIRDNPEAFDQGLLRRGLAAEAGRLLALDESRRQAIARAQEIQSQRNALSKLIGQAKARGEDAGAVIAEVAQSKEDQAEAEAQAAEAEAALTDVLAALPNLPAEDVPDGVDEKDNVELRRWGAPPAFDFDARDHVDIGEGLGMMDFEAAAKLSGARFVVLTGALARLERALAAFMLDLHTGEFGYTEVNPPALVKDAALFGTGQLPKFGEDLFKTKHRNRERFKQFVETSFGELFSKAWGEPVGPLEPSRVFTAFEELQLESEKHQQIISGLKEYWIEVLEDAVENDDLYDRFWLIPTAEVPLTNLVAGEILDAESLPRRVTAMTWCFRAEAGAAGKDTRGMIRQHQFTKVELVSVTTPEDSDTELERMTGCAEEVLVRLGLPYRTVTLCTGDIGFAARKTHDIEVWLPGQGRYREISSCSTCGDFQARRMNARFRLKGEKGTRFVHTLNGSGLAVGRALVAVLENYQRADGSVVVPEVLRPYMGGREVIARDGA